MHNKTWVITSIAAVLLLVVGLGYALIDKNMVSLPQKYFRSPSPSGKTPAQPPSHVVIIVAENKPLAAILDNPSAPYINSLMREYAWAKNYHAITNPSLPNYIAMTSGTTAGITNDCNPPGGACQADVVPITRAIDRSGRTWKMYAESMPAPCTSNNSDNYAVKHNPFMYYPSVTSNNQYCVQHVVPLTELAKDLENTASLPNYVFIAPDLCNDMHDCSVERGDKWFSGLVPKILASPAFTQQRSLLAITWDEGDEHNNNVPLIFAGSMAKRGYVSNTYYTHYSLLHTIESLWQLPSLAEQDEAAPIMYDMFH